MQDFIFREELEQATLEAAAIVCSMVDASLGAGEMPPKDILEWYANTTVYQLTQAEAMLIDKGIENPDAQHVRAAVLSLAGVVRQLLRLGIDNKMFWLETQIGDLLRLRKLRLPEAYQQMLREDDLP